MNNKRKKISAFLFACLIFTSMLSYTDPMKAYASAKTISSVSVKVKNDLSAGSDISSCSIELNSTSGGDISVSTGSTKYTVDSATFVTSSSHTVQIGDEIKIKVYLTPADYDEYRFKGTYSSSNVTINGGDFVSCSKNGTDLVVTFIVKAVKGTYEPPTDVEWSNSNNNIGRARWSEPYVSSGYFSVALLKGSQQIALVEDINTNSCDLSAYMTEKGTYRFKVRTTPHTEEEKQYGKSSSWVVSDEFYLDAEGASSSSESSQAGWIQTGSTWYYKYPDGSFFKNGWSKINNEWYLFDSAGRMLTGWQTTQSGTYFLSNSGAMLYDWQYLSDHWYYLTSDMASPTFGAMIKGTVKSIRGKSYYFDDEGIMVTGWRKIDSNWYYFYPSTGVMAISTTVDSFTIGDDGIWRK